jgi:hypothetical protein
MRGMRGPSRARRFPSARSSCRGRRAFRSSATAWPTAGSSS